MKRLYLLLLCLLVCSSAAQAATQHYPSQGVIAKFSFDGNGVSSVGNYYFTDVTRHAEESGTKTTRSDLNKYIENGIFVNAYQNPLHVRLMPSNLIFAQPQISFLMRFKLPKQHSHATIFMASSTLYVCKINSLGQIVYSCAKDKKADARYSLDYNIDLGIERDEWTTLIVTFDATKGEVSFAANGKIETLSNPAINEDYKNTSKTINQYLRFDVNDQDGTIDHADPSMLAYIDDIIFYDRILTHDEMASIFGVDGQLIEVDTPLIEPKMVIIWPITIFQMICAALIVWLLYLSSRNKLQHITPSEDGDDQAAMGYLKEALGYWHYDVDQMGCLPNSYTDLGYPQKRRYLNRSLRLYKKAAAAGSTDPEIVDAINLLADLHNSATRFIFDCKWWVFSVPVFAVYFKEMLANFLSGIGVDMTMTTFTNLPEGTIDQFLYFTHYYLPTVLFSAIVVYVSCYTQRFHRVKGKVIDQSDFRPQSIKDRLLRPIAWIIIGMVPGIGIIPLVLTGIGIYFLGKSGEGIETYKVTTRYSNGTSRTDTQADPTGAAMMLAVALGIFFAMWLAAAFIIYLFHGIFIIYVIRNHIFRKFW